MFEWMILTAAHVLKGAILGGLALISWGIHACHAPECPTALAVVCHQTAEAPIPVHALTIRVDTKPSRIPWIRLGALVPPIRVETFYTPDVLHPVLVTAPTPTVDQST